MRLAFTFLTALIPTVGDAQEGIPYDAEIVGVDGELRELILEASRLVEAEDTPPAGLAGLRQRAESDIEDFQRILRSRGYYGGRIRAELDADQMPARVTVTIDTGQLFTITECRIALTGPAPNLPRECADIELTVPAPAEADIVLDAQARLLRPFLESGYPDAEITRRVIVDHADSSMHLTYTVAPGEEARLGEVVVSGAEDTEADFLAGLRTWDIGDRYDVRLIEDYRERLSGLNLFDSILLRVGGGNGESSEVTLEVHERPPRTFGGGVRYATDEGFGTTGFWEHRNLFGAAEQLRVEATFAELQQRLSVAYGLPHRPNPDQRLDFTAAVLHELTDAYRRSGGEITGALTTPLGRYWRARFGAGVHAYEIEEEDLVERRTTLVASLPADLSYDDTDSLLDPSEGMRAVVRATPVGGTSDGALAFLRLDSEASAYFSLDDEARTVLAGRVRIGTILGATVEAVPPDWRLYSGGGGSVRAYGYQQIGPRGIDGDPIGGRSVAEAGIELRQRVTEQFGAAAFVEAGSVGRTLLGFEEPRYGAGVGVRYYTAFGPIRADIATPLNPRPGDAAIQFYISIGQAF